MCKSRLYNDLCLTIILSALQINARTLILEKNIYQISYKMAIEFVNKNYRF